MVIIISLLFVFFKYKNSRLQESIGMQYNNLPESVTANGTDNSVMLRCLNLKLGYYILGACFWTVALFFVAMVFGSLDNDKSIAFRKFFDPLITGKNFFGGYILLAAAILYFAYSRTEVRWDTSLLINGDPQHVGGYQVKKVAVINTVLYFETDNRLWILVPATKEETRKFRNAKILLQQQLANEVQVKKLDYNLKLNGVQEKHFSFFTKFLAFGFLAFVIAAITTLLMFS